MNTAFLTQQGGEKAELQKCGTAESSPTELTSGKRESRISETGRFRDQRAKTPGGSRGGVGVAQGAVASVTATGNAGGLLSALGHPPPFPPLTPRGHPKSNSWAVPGTVPRRGPAAAGAPPLFCGFTTHTHTHSASGVRLPEKTSGGKKYEERQRREETELSTEEVGGMGMPAGSGECTSKVPGCVSGPAGLSAALTAAVCYCRRLFPPRCTLGKTHKPDRRVVEVQNNHREKPAASWVERRPEVLGGLTEGKIGR